MEFFKAFFKNVLKNLTGSPEFSNVAFLWGAATS